MSLLQQLAPIVTKSKKRVGRGIASGVGGHTVGRGQKGQKSRAGGKVPLWFEGGQLPLIKRLPMLRGKDRFSVLKKTVELSLTELNAVEAPIVSLDTLKLEKIVHFSTKFVKVIATGTLDKKITLQGIKASAAAKKAIESVGGSVVD